MCVSKNCSCVRKSCFKSSLCFQKCDRNSGCRLLYNGLPEILGRFLYTYLHPLLGAGELSGESWQAVTAIHDEGDGLTLLWLTLIKSGLLSFLSCCLQTVVVEFLSNCYCGVSLQLHWYAHVRKSSSAVFYFQKRCKSLSTSANGWMVWNCLNAHLG